ncbi:MAG: hypothetical protein Q4B43_10180, partial [Bacteroidota bacterium]|nr:hypothetical protein [Bacteroidota bacterium]
ALAELEKELEILSKEEMNACKGGGDGTQNDPYTQDEFYMLSNSGNFKGGYVQGSGYIETLEGVAVFGEDKNKSVTHRYATFSGFVSTSNFITDHLARFLLVFFPAGIDCRK